MDNDLQSIDDNSILYNAVFHNNINSAIKGDVSVQFLELANEPGVKQVEYQPTQGSNLVQSQLQLVEPGANSVDVGIEADKPVAKLADSIVDDVKIVAKQPETTVNPMKAVYKLGDAETRQVDRRPQLVVQFTASELQILQLCSLCNQQICKMYQLAFSDALHGELASQYVPYIQDAEEEHNPLNRYIQLEFLQPDDVTTSLVWVSKDFAFRVSILSHSIFVVKIYVLFKLINIFLYFNYFIFLLVLFTFWLLTCRRNFRFIQSFSFTRNKSHLCHY